MKNLYGTFYCLLFLLALFGTAASAQEYSIPESIIVITSDKKPLQNSQAIRQLLERTKGTIRHLEYQYDAYQNVRVFWVSRKLLYCV